MEIYYSPYRWLWSLLVALLCFVTLGFGYYSVISYINSNGFSLKTEKAEKAEPNKSLKSKTNEQEEQYICPYSSERLLTENDLYNKTSKELRIMRNEIYARHGYIFQSKDLREYFSSKPWYSEKYNDVSFLLTEIEERNILFIKKHE